LLPKTAPARAAGEKGGLENKTHQPVQVADVFVNPIDNPQAPLWLVMSGTDLYTVGQLLGQRTPRMTQRYAHLSPKYMAGALGKLDSVFGDVMPEKNAGELRIVTIASPDSEHANAEGCNLLM
jgi:hypothetical protein